MSDWVVPIVSALIALAGGIYATRGKRATDRGDLADRLVDQIQEERDTAAKKVSDRDTLISAERAENERLRRLRHGDADYIVALRRQLEDHDITPLPYPGVSG